MKPAASPRRCNEPFEVTLDLNPYQDQHLIDLLGDRQYKQVEDAARQVELEAYGFRWFRLTDRRVT